MRTDLHRPSVIIPADYELIACDYFGSGMDAMAFAGEREWFRKHMTQTGGKFAQVTRDDGNDGSCGCDVCGAFIMYAARFHHRPSNTYITTGMDCAAKMDIGDAIQFAAFRKRVSAGLKTRKGILAAHTLLVDNGMQDVIDLVESLKASMYPDPPVDDYGHRLDGQPHEKGWYDSLTRLEQTVLDMHSNLVKYGEFKSEAQREFMRSIPAKIAEAKAHKVSILAKREADQANAKPIPAEFNGARAQITGTIVATKQQESDFGMVIKCLVQHADGWKLWGTLPSNIADDVRGRQMTFKAKVTISDKDDKFGFFSRPMKAKLLEV